MSDSYLSRDLSSMVGLSRIWLSLGLVVSLMAALLLGLPSPAGAVAGYGDVGEGTWYTDAVQWSVDNGIAGIAGTCFAPETPVSRGETAVWIYNMENQPDAGDPHSFTDVTNDAQDDAVSWMANTGVTTGTSPTTFAPDDTLRRAQVAAFLHRLADEPPAPPHSFVDVVAGWQQEPVSWMSNTGITTGTSPTTFAPEDTLTRAQLITFLYRYQDEPDVTVNTSTPICDPAGDAETVEQYQPGDTIAGFPSGFAAASGNLSNASAVVTGGGSTVTVEIFRNGSAAYSDTTYTCASVGGCTIVNGRVTKGTVNATSAEPTPDLVVGSPTVDASAPVAGEHFTLSATVRNSGDGRSASTTLRYYQSTDATITTGDTEVGRDTVFRLDAQESGDESINLTAPSVPGTYYYGACVDSTSDESDTTNNCSTAVTVIVGAAPTPDLVVDSPTVEPLAGTTTELVATFEDTIGVGETRAYDFAIRTKAPQGPWVEACKTFVKRSGRATTATFSQGFTGLEAGTTYEIRYRYRNSSQCGGGSPNEWSPVGQAATGDDEPGPSSSVFGAGDTIPGFPSGFAAASGNLSNASVVVTGGGSTVTVEIFRNGSAAYSDTTYTCESVGGCTIVNGRVTKGTVNATPVTVGAAQTPDLVVGSPTVDASAPVAGERFTLSALVRNLGDGRSASTTLRYYQSVDATITTGDTEVGTDSVFGLDAQESGDESTSVTAPSTPGTYYYGACVDSLSDESDTTNNCSTAVTVTVAALDLLGDCQDGMKLQVGQGCNYQGVGTSGAQITVLLSVRSDGAICREGGPIGIISSFEKCDIGGFERDDTFRSDITVEKNSDGSWTVHYGRVPVGAGEAPTVEPLAGTTTELVARFEDTIGVGETRAYDFAIRTKAPQGAWVEACKTFVNRSGRALTPATFSQGFTGLEPGTTYEIRYRYRNSSRCGEGSPSEWSPIAQGTTNDDEAPAGLAPEDGAAFDARFVGSRLMSRDAGFFVDFTSNGRIMESGRLPGSYRYSSIDPNSGTLTLTYDGGDYGGSCTISLTFDSATTGTLRYTCASGDQGQGNWQIEQP